MDENFSFFIGLRQFQPIREKNLIIEILSSNVVVVPLLQFRDIEQEILSFYSLYHKVPGLFE